MTPRPPAPLQSTSAGCLPVYLNRYREALNLPSAFLFGQLLTFFALSLYAKLMQMRLASEYSPPWSGIGKLPRNCLHYLLFSAEEISLFGGLLLLLLGCCRYGPSGRLFPRCGAWIVGFVALPFFSAIEVLGLAHFAFFLTPLGPEQVRAVAWAGHIISASNSLHAPGVTPGLLLVVVGYLLLPPAIWISWVRCAPPIRPRTAAAVLVAGVMLGLIPKPKVDAMLEPHPLLWLAFGDRSASLWPNSVSVAAVPEAPAGHARFSVTERPTNVLIFLLESTRAASVPFYNAAAPEGRELLPLRDEAVVFDHVYAPVPTSAHALFSILYGVYPYLGAFWSGVDKTVVADSMAQLFGRAGYTTHLYVTADLDFDNMRSFAARGFDRVLDSNEWPGQEQYTALPWGRDDRLLIEETKRLISSTRERPFFLVASTSNPHHPYATDQLFHEQPATDDEAAYERLVGYDLRLLAELYRWMKDQGVAERTLLLVLGDHGEAFGEHPGSFGHSAFIYEENVHVPCFILHPRRLGLPRRIAQLGSQVDLRATILDVIGMSDSEPGDGMSLLREDPERMVFDFTEEGMVRFAIRDRRFSYIYAPQTQTELFFDHRSDPGETNNIATLHPDMAAAYRTRLAGWNVQHQLALARILQ